MNAFDTLAEDYDAGRIGYSNDVYNTLIEYGLTPRMSVLDVGCGTGLASRPLIENGFRVTGVDLSAAMLDRARERLPAATWVVGSAQALPFPNRAFDAALGAQSFHHFDRARAIAELCRVLKPGGRIAIWWKLLTNDDLVKKSRDEVARECGVDPPPSGLPGGFKEFYAADLVDRTLRVVPWRTAVALRKYLLYERSRSVVHGAFGARAVAYIEMLEQRLRARFGDGDPMIPLDYVQFLYLAKTP